MIVVAPQAPALAKRIGTRRTVAGGLVRDGRNGLTVLAGDAGALAARLLTLAANPDLRERLGEAAREDALAYTPKAWAQGVSAALRAVGVGRAC